MYRLFLFLAFQTSLVTAGLDGTVADPTGARIPGASITVRDVATHLTRTVSSSAEGTFRISDLPPGTYEITATQAGFGPYRHAGVNLLLGTTAHLEIVLQQSNLATQITVTAQPPALDPTQTSMTSSVDTERIEELPVESRNYLHFALLAPGVASSAPQQGQQQGQDSGFTFGGLRARSNSITIDGLDNNDEYIGSSRTELSLETVREFQVVNAGLSAETGGASGGSINVITRAGANDVHGDAFVFVQNGSLNARNPFEDEVRRPVLHNDRMGLALGGPVIKGRTFFYAGFEQEHDRAEDGYDERLIPTARAETEASLKLNHQLTAKNSMMLRYAFTNNREAGDAFNNLAWTDPSARGSAFTLDHAVVGALTTVFDPQSVGDFRFQVAARQAVLRTNDTTGPGVIIAGLVQFGRPYDGNGRRNEDHRQATYTLSRSKGHHLWKAGVAVNHVHEDAAMADGFGGLYIYANRADFAAGRPNEFRQSFGAIGTNYSVTNVGAFVTDHWSIASKLALDLGLRYDFESLPAGLHQDTNNFSPRIGLAYHAAPGWMVRAGYGIFFDRYVLASLNPVLQKNGITAYEEVSGTRAIYRADPNLATPYSQQSSFAVEHLIARDLTASVSYLFVRGVKLARTRNIGRGSDLFQLEDSASSSYQGVSFTLNRRMSDELAFSGSYTLSKTYDDASDFNEQPQNPFDTRADWSVSAQHQQQRFTFNALWELPIGDEEAGKAPKNDWVTRAFGHIEVAPIFTVDSGRPVNPLTGIDSNSTHSWPLFARPAGFGRNSFRSPMAANLDFRVLKYFPFGKTSKLDVVAEAFNLLNRPNASVVNPVYGPAFLHPLAGMGARRVQFSLDFEF